MRVILSAFFICLFAATAWAQSARHNRHVPFFLTRNPQTLSFALTAGVESDSAKVQAIHSWITHHIRYDVKKFISFNYEHVPVKKILRKRKAVCVGYADLFNELCKYAGIQSVMVSGYTKNINVDITDTFYMDDHAWNAVKINGQWLPVDATWDAGYIKYYKSTWLGAILKTFTNGRRDIIHYKPHFKRQVSEVYLFTPPIFKVDHLALNPLWQLNTPTLSVTRFRNDSSFYYKRYNRETTVPVSEDGKNGERASYMALDSREKEKEDGFAGTAFNFRNQYGAGKSWGLRVEDDLAEFDPASTDTAAQIRLINTIVNHMDSGIFHFDSNAVFLAKQYTELLGFNAAKHALFQQNHKKMLASCTRAIRGFRRVYASARTTRRLCRAAVRANTTSLRVALRSTLFDNAFVPRVTRKKDSADIEVKIAALNDSILRYKKKIALEAEKFNRRYNDLLPLDSTFHWSSLTSIDMVSSLVLTRMGYFDDNDYEIRPQADRLLIHKLNNDSLLFSGENPTAYVLLRDVRRLRQEIRRQISFYKSKSAQFKRLKSSCSESKIIAFRYGENLDSLQLEISRFNSFFDIWRSRCAGLRNAYKIHYQSAGKEKEAIESERSIENEFNGVRRSYIRGRYNALRGVNSRGSGQLDTKRKKLLKLRDRLVKKR